jgi:phosphonate metabolism-associated iron-containing alcohol dehydrogenase
MEAAASIARYHNPVQSVFGAGALEQLPALLNGQRAALVIFPEARGIGLLDRIATLLGPQLAQVIDDVRPNPDVAELEGTWTRFWRDPAAGEVLVAIGGGSVIDTAKALMVGNDSLDFGDMVRGLSGEAEFRPTRFRRLIAVPTTAGTGSEVTPWATLWDRGRQRKYSLHLPQTWPSHAVIDPQLMLSLPASATLAGGLDALSHALEAIWNVNANPVSDTFAVSAVREVMQVLPALMQDLGNLSLRSGMALAALKAGMAFSNTKTALAHSLSYEMTLRHGLAHGIACSFPLPFVMERAIGHVPQRDAVLAQALGVPASEGPALLARFIESLGVKTRFADYGVSDAELQRMVREALAGARGRNFIGAAA